MKLAWALFPLLCSCATVSNRAHTMEYAPASANPEEKSRVLAAYDAARELPKNEETGQVLLFVETLPVGIESTGRHIAITPASSYAMLGAFDFYAGGGSTFWFAEYASSGRKAYCYPQVPLTWLTLGLWQVLVPLSWPCIAKARVDPAYAWAQVRAIAAAAHADAAVVRLRTADDQVVDAWGWLLRKR